MTWNKAAVARFLGTILLAGATSASLAGCSSIDEALFGGETPEQPAAQAAGQPAAATAPAPAMAATSASAPGITPIPIEQGSDTGTSVGHTVQSQRSELSSLQDKVISDAQQFATLRDSAAQSATSYHEAKAHITTRLQVGTTRGNPELVSEWNTAQGALDALTANINSLNALGTDVANDASRAHYELDTIQASFNISGAVDEDHRQLSALQDEASQIIVIIDHLLGDVSQDVQRQTAYVANERASLTTLAAAIKNGEYYGTDLGSPMMAGAPAAYGAMPGGAALVTIRFDHPHVAYQQILYTALNQALQSRPGASFSVVAVSPTRGTAAAVQLAQSEAQRRAQDVLRSMTDMGVPANRLGISSSTDPAIGSSEVRVYER